jgi:hypothetical protein
MERRKKRGVSALRRGAGQIAVFGLPGRARSAHIVPFRPVGADGVAGHYVPKAREKGPDAGRRPGQSADRRSVKCCYGATHRSNSLPHDGHRCPLTFSRPLGRPGSCVRIIADSSLRSSWWGAAARINSKIAFPEFYRRAGFMPLPSGRGESKSRLRLPFGVRLATSALNSRHRVVRRARRARADFGLNIRGFTGQ